MQIDAPNRDFPRRCENKVAWLSRQNTIHP